MDQALQPSGQFCWFNVMTPETERARAFFARLLGWQYTEMPGMGHSIQVDGCNVGGMFDVVSPQTPDGMAPTIGVMIKVDDTDAMVARVRALGGKASDAWNINDHGRMSVTHDPSGGGIDLWQVLGAPSFAVNPRAHGAPSWIEVMTRDMKGTADYYTRLFDWTVKMMPAGPIAYAEFSQGAKAVAGMLGITAEMGTMPQVWNTYFTVRSCADAIALATSLGAQICMPMKQIEHVGNIVALVSPQGVMFYLIEYEH